jgi:hypothetical protein
VTGTFAQIAVVGPGAARAVSIALGAVEATPWRRSRAGTCAPRDRRAGHRHARDRYRRTGFDASWTRNDRATVALDAAGVVEAGEATAEAIRIEAGFRRSTAIWTRRRSARGEHRIARDQLQQAATSGRKW